MSNVDDLPEWINRSPVRPTTDKEMADQLTSLNYLQGMVLGQAHRLDRQAEIIRRYMQEVQELEQQVDIARAYEREKLALHFEGRDASVIARLIRGAALDG